MTLSFCRNYQQGHQGEVKHFGCRSKHAQSVSTDVQRSMAQSFVVYTESVGTVKLLQAVKNMGVTKLLEPLPGA